MQPRELCEKAWQEIASHSQILKLLKKDKT